MAPVLAYLTLCVIALCGLVLLRAVLVMPQSGPRLGGWCALLSGIGIIVLLLPTVPVGPARGDVETRMLTYSLSSFVGLGLMLVLRGFLRLDEPRFGRERTVSWRGFRWGLPIAALLPALAVGWQRGRLPATRTLPVFEGQLGLVYHSADVYRVVGLLCLALGVGMVPGLVSRKSVVHEAMLAAGVLGVPCAAYAALRVAAERPLQPLLHDLAGPAAIAAVCGVLLSALYVRRWQLLLDEDSAEHVGREDLA